MVFFSSIVVICLMMLTILSPIRSTKDRSSRRKVARTPTDKTSDTAAQSTVEIANAISVKRLNVKEMEDIVIYSYKVSIARICQRTSRRSLTPPGLSEGSFDTTMVVIPPLTCVLCSQEGNVSVLLPPTSLPVKPAVLATVSPNQL